MATAVEAILASQNLGVMLWECKECSRSVALEEVNAFYLVEGELYASCNSCFTRRGIQTEAVFEDEANSLTMVENYVAALNHISTGYAYYARGEMFATAAQDFNRCVELDPSPIPVG